MSALMDCDALTWVKHPNRGRPFWTAKERGAYPCFIASTHARGPKERFGVLKTGDRVATLAEAIALVEGAGPTVEPTDCSPIWLDWVSARDRTVRGGGTCDSHETADDNDEPNTDTEEG